MLKGTTKASQTVSSAPILPTSQHPARSSAASDWAHAQLLLPRRGLIGRLRMANVFRGNSSAGGVRSIRDWRVCLVIRNVRATLGTAVYAPKREFSWRREAM